MASRSWPGTDLASQPDVAYVSPPQYDVNRNAAVLTVIPRTSPQDSRTSALVRYLRDTVAPRATAGTGVTALIGGQTAASIDTAGVISARLVVVVAFVIALSVLLLMAAFRSVVIPLVSAGLTLLSTGAAYGVIVAVCGCSASSGSAWRSRSCSTPRWCAWWRHPR